MTLVNIVFLILFGAVVWKGNCRSLNDIEIAEKQLETQINYFHYFILQQIIHGNDENLRNRRNSHNHSQSSVNTKNFTEHISSKILISSISQRLLTTGESFHLTGLDEFENNYLGNYNSAGVIIPNVCGLCPVIGLEPCECISNAGTRAGSISIYCPPSVDTQVDLENIIRRTPFTSYNVSTFSLEDSTIGGVINSNLFGPLMITYLELNHDKFRAVDERALINSYETLKSLSLVGNEISYIFSGEISRLKKLRYLKLQENQIEYILSHAFHGEALKFLNLSSNSIIDIGYHAFSNLTQITTLDVSHNNVTHLRDFSFSFQGHNNSGYMQIFLQNNALSNISATAFGGLEKLILDLQNNNLTTIEEIIFLPLINNAYYGASFYMEGNPINCDCDIWWVVKDPALTSCFDNFQCSDRKSKFYDLYYDATFICDDTYNPE